MKRKKKKIYLKRQRVVLSDVLPYEVPPFFSNRYFYDFLVLNGFSFEFGANKKNAITWKKDDPILDVIAKILFGFTQEKPVINRRIEFDSEGGRRRWRIPFKYKIAHKKNDFRELTIVHPINQLEMISFYHEHKELILYYCNTSPVSIRRPSGVARTIYYNDKIHLERLAYDHEHKSAEEFDKEYKNLKTYFTYKKISNVHKFYESPDYIKCEKKYEKLYKYDIAKCFDSIYTHTITWAILGKDSAKDYTASNSSFAGSFDLLMQSLNHGETNGIVIGPEFSRIFSEIILQKIDADVLRILESKHKRFRVDYEIFRYVDDYFIFYNEDETKELIKETYKHQLREYKLYLNDAKDGLLEKPMITGITIAKQSISDLLKDSFTFEESLTEQEQEQEQERKYSIYVASNRLITKFKTIIKTANIEYKDIINYTLACIDRQVIKLINIYSGVEDKSKQESRTAKAILKLLEFAFFIYSVSPRANTTIKLSLILSKLIRLVKLPEYFNHDLQHLIFKEIYDDIFLVLRKNKNSEYVQIETLYLIAILKELGRAYRLGEEILCKYFSIDLKKKECQLELNYFSIIAFIFYIGDKPRYAPFMAIFKDHIRRKYQNANKKSLLKTTELTLLLFDLLTCPYLDCNFKKELLEFYEISDANIQEKIISRKGYWFTKWSDYDLIKELEAKRSQEVYT